MKKQVKSGIIYTENSGGLTVAVLSVQYRNSADFAERNAFMYKIVTKKSLNPTVTLMEIEAPLVAAKAKPGQFIILRVDEDGERIPLTVAGTDRERGTVKIIFQIVGRTTKKLSFKEQRELDALPAQIAALEGEQNDITALLVDGSLYASDNARAVALAARNAEIDDELMSALERWEALGGS